MSLRKLMMSSLVVLVLGAFLPLAPAPSSAQSLICKKGADGKCDIPALQGCNCLEGGLEP